ncbi:methyltransferase family protein [Candidatus Neomarinimicrobiota bacterium]
MIVKVIIFAAATVGIIYLSRGSLLNPRSHGFYRFWAWEVLLMLLMLNVDDWFQDPFSVHQIISWCLLTVCIYPVVHGTILLRRVGKPDQERDDVPMVGIEKTTILVTEGIYRHIRHPLYSSLFLLGWGIFFKDPSWLGGGLAAAATVLLVVTAKIEEGENVRYFGPAYEEYMQRTKMFVPFLF